MKVFIFLCVIFVTFGLIFAESNICLQPVEAGACYAAKPRFAYNREGGCQQFTYGGCGGNDNNFDTYQECEKACLIPR